LIGVDLRSIAPLPLALAQDERLGYTLNVARQRCLVLFAPSREKRGPRMTDEEKLMVEGKARWLLEGGVDELDDEERALLLALVSLEADTGRQLTEEEKQALEKIVERSGVDGEEISRAVKHMVEAKPKKDSGLDWSALKNKFRRKK
jgi:hypothetical protein